MSFFIILYLLCVFVDVSLLSVILVFFPFLCFFFCLFFFFFKQKTAYEMRISDWSSDVCSSDLMPAALFRWNENGDLMEIGVSPAQADVSPNSIAAQKPNSPATAPFRFCERAATPALQQAISQRMPPLPGYQSEIHLRAEARSEERRVGKAWVSTCRSRCAPDHKK